MLIHSTDGFKARHNETDTALIAAFRTVSDRLLTTLHGLLELIDSPRQAEACAQVAVCRKGIATAEEPEQIEQLIKQCLDACDKTREYLATRRSEQHREIAELITTVREALSAIAGDVDSFNSGVNQSMDRFEELAKVDDIRELKARLAAEVVSLKKMTLERHQKWQDTLKTFSDRIVVLEHQLDATQREASIDPLTQVANRGTFDRTCQEWLHSGLNQFVLVLLDVDDFKKINDTHGHAAGDRVLVAVASALKTAVRSNQDLVARIGGDEFAVLAIGLNLRQAEVRFQNFISKLAPENTRSGDAPLPAVGISCGISEFSAGDTVESLSQRADQALYEAKRAGKNRVFVKRKPYLRDLLGR